MRKFKEMTVTVNGKNREVYGWQVYAIAVRRITPLDDKNRINWTAICEEVDRRYDNVLNKYSCKTNALRKWFVNNPEVVAAVEAELAKMDKADAKKKIASKSKKLPKAPAEVVSTKKQLTKSSKKRSAAIATSAHVNDDDKTYEAEDEVVNASQLIASEQKKDGTCKLEKEIVTTETDIDNADKIAKYLGINQSEFEIVSYCVRKGTWDAQTKGGEIKELHSYRISANMKKRTPDNLSEQDFKKTMEDLRDYMKDKKPIVPYKIVKPVDGGENIAVICVADLHYGKLAWWRETNENYDHRIARANWFYIISKAIERIKATENVEKIIFFWSQDFFHYDTIDVTTTAGTRQDTDVRWQKLFYEGVKLLVEGLKMVRDAFPGTEIDTFYTRSNHDTQTSFYATVALAYCFKDDPYVKVDDSPVGRKYVEYGVNLMGFGHGDKEGERIASIMPNEAPEAWGRTWNHEYFLGHYHSEKVRDDRGVVRRYLASPTSTDAWHYESGYIGAQKAAQVFIRNKADGPIAEYTISVRSESQTTEALKRFSEN